MKQKRYSEEQSPVSLSRKLKRPGKTALAFSTHPSDYDFKVGKVVIVGVRAIAQMSKAGRRNFDRSDMLPQKFI